MPVIPAVAQVITDAVADGRIAGAVVLASKDGTLVHADEQGVLEQGSDFTVHADTVFWLASLTKVICAAAVLTLVDDGLMALTDPIAKFVPEFAEPGTVRELAPGSPPILRGSPFAPPPEPRPIYECVPSTRPLQVLDVLTHTSGLQSIGVYNEDYHRPEADSTLQSYVPSLASVPRDFQPGTKWAYSNAGAFELLGRAVEVASGQPYDRYLASRLLEPLGVPGIGFGKADTAGAIPVGQLSADPVVAGRGYYSAAAGMWGTPLEYLVFLEMLRNGGVHSGAGGSSGRRLLSGQAVDLLATNHVGELCPGLNGRGHTGGVGFGLGVAVITDQAAAGTRLPTGTFGWDGINTRRFWINRAHGWSVFMFVPSSEVQVEVETALATALG